MKYKRPRPARPAVVTETPVATDAIVPAAFVRPLVPALIAIGYPRRCPAPINLARVC